MYFFSCGKSHRIMKEVQLEKKKNSVYRSKLEMVVGCYLEEKKRVSDSQYNTNPSWYSRIKGSRYRSRRHICIIPWITVEGIMVILYIKSRYIIIITNI
jgi:hypothetical protein